MLWFMRLPRVGHDWATELNWTDIMPVSACFLAPLILMIAEKKSQVYYYLLETLIDYYGFNLYFQFSSVPQSCLTLSTPWTAAHQASLSITNSRSLPKLISIELVMPSNHLILCCPLLLLPSIFPSIRVFSNESALCMRWPKYWSFSFNISPSNEHPGLISFRMDWLDLLAVQGTFKSLLQHHSSKASILQQSGPQRDICTLTFIAALLTKAKM